MDILNLLKIRKKEKRVNNSDGKTVVVPPGRVSIPDDSVSFNVNHLKDYTSVISPTFKVELIKLLRDLYKVNPDVGVAVQDMFKLANTGHEISFPQDDDKTADMLKTHLLNKSKTWNQYTAGIEGCINRMIVQCLVTGAISLEAVPNKKLDGISNILLIKPESIRFSRKSNGSYEPYQLATNILRKDNLVKLNPTTFFYASMYNDIDEPFGIPPFLTALDSLDGQSVMKENFKNMMEQSGLLGFMEATIEKTAKRATENETAYAKRLESELRKFKESIKQGMIDGVLVGHIGDHEFKFNSTTKDMSNVDKFWNMNQQSVANGLGVSGNIIGIQQSNTEGGAGILLSKMISQLRNIQMIISYVLTKIYELELLLAGLPHKGLKVTFGTSTISDELKVQQGKEIKVRNLKALYDQGIISQEDFAWEMGYQRPAEPEPRLIVETEDSDDAAKKQADEKKKDANDRKNRDKAKVVPKRKDQKQI